LRACPSRFLFIIMFDVHVRLRIEDLASLPVEHIYSELEEAGGETGLISGFTEWRAQATRLVSCGWDWTYESASAQLSAQWSSLRTNLMVVDDAGQDMGVECARLCLARLMTHARWERVVAGELGLPLRTSDA
jgi:Domain of unknown function (DUF4902)